MTLIWLGVLLVFGGMLHMAFQPIWRGKLSRRPERPSDNTLEPTSPAAGFGIKSNWPGSASCAWRRFLAGRGCHLNLKPTSTAPPETIAKLPLSELVRASP